jgi:hypothetical protein
MSGDVSAQERSLLGLFESLWQDPKVGSDMRRRAKELNPNVRIPDDHPVAVEVRGELSEALKKVDLLQKMFDETQAKSAARDAETDLRSKLGKAQDRFRLTDEGMAGTIKLMQDRQISDPEAAAALYVDGLPKAKPSTPSSSVFTGKLDLFGTTSRDDQWEKLHTDGEGFFRDVVNEVFNEMPVGA